MKGENENLEEEVENLRKRSNTIIHNSKELRDLLKSDKKEEVNGIIIESGCCNDMKEDVEISGLGNLTTIYVKKNSLNNLSSLTICNNEKLRSIEVENGDRWQKDGKWFANGAFFWVKSVVFKGK